MFAVFRKIVLASLVVLTVLTMGAWQNGSSVPAESQNTSILETPLYPGLTWSSVGSSTQNIRINIKGDSISVSGERFEAREQFVSNLPLPEDLVNYYSTAELAKSGWVSYDTFDESDGVHYIFYHESGVYLSVEFLKCSDTNTCVAVWKSEQVNPEATMTAQTPERNELTATTTSTFGKISPADGATGLNASNVTLRWESYSSAQKYTYCIQTDSECAAGQSNWTSTYNTSVTLTNLAANRTYYWQVRALICGSCTPKTWVYANSGNNWSFQTATSRVAIVGNAGVSGAVLSYVDGIHRTVTSNSTGAYSITVPYNWSGTITPTKSGYLFYPISASFTNLTAAQTIQNFTAAVPYVVSGNASVSGVTLSYIDHILKTVVTDSSGNYSFVVPAGWNGTVTPSHACFTFNPPSLSYSNVTTNKTLQNYAASLIAGCADIDVSIGGAHQGRYGVPAISSIRDSYTNVLGGPVKVTSSTGGNILASQRAIYGNSFNEMMGYPANQFVKEYWFPWYDGVYMRTWILVGNPGSSQTAYVDIYIGGVKQNTTPYSIASGQQITPLFLGMVNGPVRVVSVTGSGTPTPINIFASERSIYNGSFNEVMGVPFNQFTTEYWFPWYDGVYMTTWVLVGNPSSSQIAYVDIYINGVKMNDTVGGVPYAIPANGNITPKFPGLVNGPVRVVSVTGTGTPSPINIFTSERSIYSGTFSEVMGIPLNQFTTDYWFPWVDQFNTNNMQTWVLVGNPSASQTAYVDIYIGGIKQGATRTVAPNGHITPTFTTTGGPVRVVSVTGTGTPTPLDIFTSERTLYLSSFNEMMGYPADQLTTDYWFPWYDNLYMHSDIFVSKP